MARFRCLLQEVTDTHSFPGNETRQGNLHIKKQEGWGNLCCGTDMNTLMTKDVGTQGYSNNSSRHVFMCAVFFSTGSWKPHCCCLLVYSASPSHSSGMGGTFHGSNLADLALVSVTFKVQRGLDTTSLFPMVSL